MSVRRWWPWLRRVLTLGFFGLVAWLIFNQAKEVDWASVGESVAGYSPWALAAAAALATLSYALYCSFDLIGKAYTGHRLPAPAVLLTTFISYAFNLNFGALVGGAGFRFRLYAQQGLRVPDISRVLALSMLANWSGYVPLMGGLLLAGAVPLPESWRVVPMMVRAIGGGMILVAAGYLALCAFSPRRSLCLRGHEIVLPTVRMATLQLAISMANWMTMATIPYLLLGGQVAYPTVLAVLLAAAVAGVITHVPAGLGVLEAVFLTLLGRAVPAGEVLAALLTYRAFYYLAPLALALAAFLTVEVRTRKQRAS